MAICSAQELENQGWEDEDVPPAPTNGDLMGWEPESTNGDGAKYTLEYEQSGPAPIGPSPGSEPNALWIVTNNQQTTSQNVPFGGYARLRLITSNSGQCVIFETYPDGQTRRFTGNQVNAGNWYRMGFIGDMAGQHILWYTINGVPSNRVTFNVGRGSGGGGSGGSGSGGGSGCQTNRYADQAAANAASCAPGSVTACCGSSDSCVDCGGDCYAPGRYGSRVGDLICSNGRWSLARSRGNVPGYNEPY